MRAMYLYSGVADVAAYTGDERYVAAMNKLWDDVVLHKMYITGGIGARHEGEAFGDPYELPNESAYCETCAAIGLALWSHRLNLLHGDAQYADVLERVIYNGVLSGIGMDGEHYFYVNPLAADGNHHRQPFYACACCPTNAVRFLPSLPGYVYATSSDGIYVNLYVAGDGQIALGDTPVSIRQVTEYPWDGRIKLTVSPQTPGTFDLHLRIPGWCTQAQLSVNGEPRESRPNRKGYVVLHREWKAGDTVDLQLHDGRAAYRKPIRAWRPMPDAWRSSVVRWCIALRPWTTGARSAISCSNGIRSSRSSSGRICSAASPSFVPGARRSASRRRFRTTPGTIATPARCSCGCVRMANLANRSATSLAGLDDCTVRSIPSTLGPSQPLELSDLLSPSASHCWGRDNVMAVVDGREPKNSHDQSLPRMTWWDHRGTTEWVQYDLEQPTTCGLRKSTGSMTSPRRRMPRSRLPGSCSTAQATRGRKSRTLRASRPPRTSSIARRSIRSPRTACGSKCSSSRAFPAAYSSGRSNDTWQLRNAKMRIGTRESRRCTASVETGRSCQL